MALQERIQIEIEILEGKELVSMDSNGLSDPFVVVCAEGKRLFKTTVKPKTLNPVWTNESFFVSLPSTVTTITLECWDKDLLKNDRMGFCEIKLDSIVPHNFPQNSWWTLRPMKKDDPVSGFLRLKLTRYARVLPKLDEGNFKNPLFASVSRGDLLLLVTTLKQGNVDINATDSQGETPLHRACAFYENEHILLTLLEKGGDNLKAIANVDGNFPLHIFAKNFSNPNCVRALDLLLKVPGADLHATNVIGETALHRTILNPTTRVLIAHLLIEKGANVNATTTPKGLTPLHYAVELVKVDAVACLIEHGADLDIKDSNGKKPVDIAIQINQMALAKRLQEYQAVGNYLDSIGLGAFKKKFFAKKLFMHRLRTVTDLTLESFGITCAEQRQALLDIFSAIPGLDHAEQTFSLSFSQGGFGGGGGGMLMSQISYASSSSTTPMKQLASINEKDIEFHSFIGEGTSGKVYNGTYRGNAVAIKVIEGSTQEEHDDFLREFEIVQNISSPNILKMYGIIFPSPGSTKIAIVMEYAENGSLYHLLSSDFKLTWKLTISLFEQATNGLLALHNHNPPILHRDLKTLNLLMTGLNALKICDFGLSRFAVAENYSTLQRLRGTYIYLAPDVCSGKSYSEESDIYSLGIIFWEIINKLLTKKYQKPFSEFEQIKIDYQVVILAKKGLRPTIPSSCPSSVRNLIQLCLQMYAPSRPSCEEILTMISEIKSKYTSNPSEFESCLNLS